VANIEFLILANHAEAKNGLLYLLGGGWTDHWRKIAPNAPVPVSHFGIGVAVNVPWDDTNRPHRLTIRMETDDGKELAKIEGDVNVGRPPTLPPGSDQRAILAFNVDTQWPAPGGYRIVSWLSSNPENLTAVKFRVHDQMR
jgi:hypothetical protein